MSGILIILISLIYSITVIVLINKLERYINYYRTEETVSEKLRNENNIHMDAYINKLQESQEIKRIILSKDIKTAAEVKKEILHVLTKPSNTSE